MKPSDIVLAHETLGGMLLDRALLIRADSLELSAAMFQNLACRELFKILADSRKDGGAMSVEEAARRLGEKIGEDDARTTVAHSAAAHISAHSWERTALYFVRLHSRRMAAERAESLSALLETEGGKEKAVEAAEEALRFAKRWALPSARFRFVSISQSVAEAADLAERNTEGGKAFRTGISGLDAILHGGLRRGELTVVAGATSNGKSALALQIALCAAKQGVPALYCTLEMPATDCAMRLIAAESDLPLGVLRGAGGRLDSDDWSRFEKAAQAVESLPLTFVDRANCGWDELRALLEGETAYGRYGLCVIDYVQLFRTTGVARHEMLADACADMKGMAVANDCCFLAVSQLNRAYDDQESTSVKLSNLSQSSGLEKAADSVIAIRRWRGKKENEDGSFNIDLSVIKNRNGPTGEASARFEPQFARFSRI